MNFGDLLFKISSTVELGCAITITKEEAECLVNGVDKLKNPAPSKVGVLCNKPSGPKFFCPSCGKQQKASHKNFHKGCYCERCGTKLYWEFNEDGTLKLEEEQRAKIGER